MKNRIFFFLLLITTALTSTAFAEPVYSVTGLVKDGSDKPLSRVTVSLLRAKDSSLVKTEITNTDGRFEIKTAGGSYFLSYSIVGFSPLNSAVFTIAGDFTANEAKLAMASKKLEGVVITAKKPMIEVKADKTVFNVEGSINAQGSNALELLQKSPGMRVDQNDNISMKGKSGVKVYIDGKLSPLDAKSLADYLRSINSNDIEAIEMISSPGAKYDASGNSGIINIRLKKNKKFGTNGSVSAGFSQGVTPKGNSSINLNYRDKLINIFGNASINGGEYHNTINIYRIQNDTLFDQKSSSLSRGSNYNFKAGADFFANKNNTFGVLLTGGSGNRTWTNNSHTDISYQPTGGYQKSLVAQNRNPGSRSNLATNLNFHHTDSTGKDISVDADYGIYRNDGSSYQPNYYYNSNGSLLYSVINRNNTPVDIDIFTLKADVELNKWGGKLGYGAKTSFVTTQNALEFFNDINNVTIKNNERSNQFRYVENINAAYVNYQRQLGKKWSMQAGLRSEQTNSEGNLTRDDGKVQSDNNVKRHYIDLFPNGGLSFNANEKNTFSLSYSRRINRPSYQDLNPFEGKLDELTYEKGNAFLRPQYTNSIEAAHVFKGILNTTLSYSHVKDYYTQVIDTTNGNATFAQQQNIAALKTLGLSIGSSLPIAKWWNGYVNAYLNGQRYEGVLAKQQLTIKAVSFGGYLQNTFNLGKDYSAELSGWFNGPGVDANVKSKAQGAMDIGFQKLFLQKKATIKISATDILHTAGWGGTLAYGSLRGHLNGTWESQTVRLNFTYRFGNSQVKTARQHKSGLESEAGRVK